MGSGPFWRDASKDAGVAGMLADWLDDHSRHLEASYLRDALVQGEGGYSDYGAGTGAGASDGTGDGYGDGYGDGHGDGDGYGDGYGDGAGYGYI